MEQDRGMIATDWGDPVEDSQFASRRESDSRLSAGEGEAPDRDILDFEPVALRARCDGWTREKQRAFIEALADCGIVREAAARVGMTQQSASRLRGRPDAAAFNRAWEAALEIGADCLHSIAYERAVTGVSKPFFYRGEQVGEQRIYDNRLLIFLLGKAEQRAAREDSKPVIANWDAWMQAIEDGLDAPPPSPDEGERPPVWIDADDAWWTEFPPPPGFDGRQSCKYGKLGYARHCTRDERMALAAMRARREVEACRRRDLYFTRLKSAPAPT